MTSTILAKTPFRVSFGGGGTDIETYYIKHGGLVVSTTIDKYFYSVLMPRDDDRFELASADYGYSGVFDSVDKIPDDDAFRIPKAVLAHLGCETGIKLFMSSEIPAGTGLGSSCAVSVNLVNLISTYLGKQMDKEELAETAFYIDTGVLGFPIGKQDQYASAFGGLNMIEFTKDGVTVKPLDISKETIQMLDDRIMLFFGGSTRNASSILTEQKADSASNKDVISSLDKIKELAIQMKTALEDNDLDGFGNLLHESWLSKRTLNKKVSNDFIDEAYTAARRAGATGGKIAGAGGGGFLILYCDPAKQPDVTKAMSNIGWNRMDFCFENKGSMVLR